MFLMDLECGLFGRQQLVDAFELPIALFRRSINEARATKKDVYIRHR